MSVLAALIAGLAWAGPAHAGFVPALGSPFPYAAPTLALAVADGDRNGTVDVVAGGLTLRRGNGTGFLGNPIAVGTTGPVEGLAGGDLDGDGLTDYAAIAPGAPRQLLRFTAVPGNGFARDVLLPDAGAATDVAIGDLDGDRLPDLAVVRDEDDPNVTVVYGGRPGAEQELRSELGSPRDVALGDLDGDGRPEIVVAGDEARVSVLRNVGGGDFADGQLEPTGGAGASRRVAIADVDGDGRNDAIATDSASAALLVLAGDGAGGLRPSGSRPTGLAGSASSLAAGDVDGDGRVDLVAGGDGRFAALLGDGAGGFGLAPGSPYPTGALAGDTVADLALADMNRDMQVDVVTANRNGSASVLLNDGTGLLGAAPAAVDFGTLLPASGPRTQTIVLRANRGQLRITRFERQGSVRFAVRNGDCLGRTLALGQACTLSVSFDTPRKARRYEALLSVDANAAAVVIPLAATPRPPVVRRPRLKRKRVRAGQRLDLRYRLSEDARTRVLVQRVLPGRRVGGRCVAVTRANRAGRRCAFWVTVAKVARRDLAGAQRMRVATRGRATGSGRRRKPGLAYPAGAYRLSVSATDRFRNRSKEQLARFVLLPSRSDARRKTE